MLAITAPLMARLQALPQLTGWSVRSSIEHADRREAPAADVRVTGAIATAKSGGVMVGPQWAITLVVPRNDQAAERLDAAMSAVICSLQGWKPGAHGGRGWEPLSLLQVTEPMIEDVGLVGYELLFSTSGLYMGQQ